RHVQAVVIPVDEVNIRVSRRAKEDSVAFGHPGGGVGGRIALAEISFDFDDAADEPLLTPSADQHLAQQVAGDAARVAGEERAGEAPGRPQPTAPSSPPSSSAPPWPLPQFSSWSQSTGSRCARRYRAALRPSRARRRGTLGCRTARPARSWPARAAP